ncbi:BTAD domain-containing putative transcriptional regulator [Streptomyces sp. NPDC090127]|uniref:BTAD domain-containing putative transcriptional regulator n=1 Tax=Streptomyces sp. NPDC090127 TaxID=3365953 RepID=UPI00382B68DD
MRFQLLGPLSLADGTESVVLAPSRPTNLLAALLLHANGVVSADYLQQAIWGEDQPATAKAALQTCVMRLRRLFVKHGVTRTPIEAVPGGYRIEAGPRTLDLIGFRDQVGRAAAERDPDAELHLLKDALSLWHGAPLANVRSDVLHRDVVPRLVEERLRAVERVCDLHLALDRCGDALVDLWDVTRAHPGYERFHEQLIEALYRTGRQAEALAEYRRIKEYLLDELGVDPSPALRRLELAILRGDDLGPARSGPAASGRLSLPAPTQAPAPTAEAGPSLVAPVPVVPSFTGRAAEVAAMTARLTQPRDEAVTVLVSGAPGIGKSALAAHVAHLVRDAFPGGRLLVRMTDPHGAPRPPGEVAAEVAAALRDRRPEDRALLVLDDVTDAEQVRPLLPVGPGGAAVVTSRMGLAGLIATHGGWVHRLSVFAPEESHRLLHTVLGPERAEAEPDAVRRLAELCGHFPLALRIAAARLLTRPELRLADGADWLAGDPVGRLALPDSPDMSVDRVLAGALGRLDPRLAELFGRLGALPAEFSAEECARGSEEAEGAAGPAGPARSADRADRADRAEVEEVEETLERLADSGLLEAGPPGPYRMHDLLRRYARRSAERSRAERGADPSAPHGTGRSAEPGAERGAARGGDHGAPHGTDRSAEAGADPGAQHSTDGSTDRSTDPSTERGTDPRADRMADRNAERTRPTEKV